MIFPAALHSAVKSIIGMSSLRTNTALGFTTGISARHMEEGKHFCGLDHAFRYASNVMTPNHTDANRESTLELNPPLNREGTKPIESVVAEVEESLSDRID